MLTKSSLSLTGIFIHEQFLNTVLEPDRNRFYLQERIQTPYIHLKSTKIR